MGAFNTKAVLNGNPSYIPEIADRICQEFSLEGYEIHRENLLSGGVDISITKGGIFKAVLGMKTALKITMVPTGSDINFEAGIGIFGQQIVPTLIMLFITWPVLITQIWGLVKQSKLDDKALRIAQSVINSHGGNTYAAGTVPPPVPPSSSASDDAPRFCTNCGTRLPSGARFCSNCGSPLN